MSDFEDSTALIQEQEVKLFGRWATSDLIVGDISLTVSALFCFYFDFLK